MFKYADKIKAKNVLIIGEDELREGKYKLKNMNSGEEKALTIEEMIGELSGE